MLAELLHPERVNIALEATDKEAAVRALAALLVRPESEANEESVHDVLMERERLASTGVGSGVAIPHGRFDGVVELRAAVAVCADGVDFDAVDGLPVKILVAIVGPRSMPQKHLAALAGVSRVLRNSAVRDALIAADDNAEAYHLLVES
ncbi:MAG: PTS sugar transporter subunit IIA [Myxococcales bacterium]|nr:PTS sugar transporter subunit IIA [Myxococcales bacterium]MDH3484048.1 PTS sugar transporter subunit IIA [Myxococcales bacterium]